MQKLYAGQIFKGVMNVSLDYHFGSSGVRLFREALSWNPKG
jgi:hypothetical protein